MDGQKDGSKQTRVHGWVGERKEEGKGGRKCRWMDGWVGGWMDG